MADKRSTSVGSSSASLPALEEIARLASDEDVTARRKQRRSERDATRIYLYEQHKRWHDLMQELSLKTDKELAAMLLDEDMACKERRFWGEPGRAPLLCG